MAEIKSLLDDVIVREIKMLGNFSSEDEEKAEAIRHLASLHKLRIEEIKAETEAEDKRERRALDSEKHKTELALKEQQARQQEAQQQAELAIKTRQLDGGDADRVLKEQQMQAQTEQQMAELALRERELNGKEADRAREEALQARQAREQEIDRYVRIGVAAAELVLPLAFYGIWMGRGFKFEESGAYTSGTFKNLFNRFKPTKKG